MQISDQNIKTGTATGALPISISPLLSSLTVAVDGVDSVIVSILPYGMTESKVLEGGTVTGSTPATFSIVPSYRVILTPSNPSVEFTYTIGQY